MGTLMLAWMNDWRYHPLRKIETVLSGLRYAVLYDFVEERHNEKIKVIKDIAAAAVGIAIFTWMVVIGVELGRYFDA